MPAAGHAKTVTTWYANYVSTSLGANTSIGTMYKLLHADLRRDDAYGVYIADTGASSYLQATTFNGAISRGSNAIKGSGDLGETGTYIGSAYVTRYYLNSTAYLDGANGGGSV